MGDVGRSLSSVLIILLPVFFSSFFLPVSVKGQSLCTGSLGDPIINLTFGKGTGRGPALDPGVTGYLYNGSTAINDGEYTLSNNVQEARPGWHNLEDHTPGDVNGYMLAINADDKTTGEFYRGTVSGLCRNTVFEFSAWIANANTPNTCGGGINLKSPNVVFRIEDMDGNRVGSISTGDIPPSETPRWDNYGFTFNTGEKTDFVLIMENNNLGGCGNDLAIDDITFRACGPSLEVSADGYTSTEAPYVCQGAVIDLVSTIGSGYADPHYQWQFSADDGQTWDDIPGSTAGELRGIAVGNTGSYRALVAADAANLSSPFCRVVSNPVKVTVVPPLSIEQQPADITSCLNEPPFLEILASGGYPAPEYQWESSPEPAGPWSPVEDAVAFRYSPPADAAGNYYYRCILTTGAPGCAPLVSRTAVLTVLRQIVTLELPVNGICADAAPVLLSGGQPGQIGNDQTGIYSGPGVINGYFDPKAAGGPGSYELQYTLTNTSGCQYVASDMIEVYPSASADAGSDKKMLEGTYVILEGTGSGTDFSWSPAEGLDNPGSPTPRASPGKKTEYTLTVTTAEGCTSTDVVTVDVLKKLTIPNTFTPNHDGVNDTWNIDGISDYPDVILKIFNRWGAEVYRTKGYGTSWDGTSGGGSLPGGTYYYLLEPGIFLEPIFGSITIIR